MDITLENLRTNQINFYEDILYERRNSSDLRWAVQEWEEESKYKFKQEMDKKKLYSLILNSQRVAFTIENLIEEGEDRKYLKKRVLDILDDMNHTLDVGEIRKFAFSLPKIMKQIYNNIYVNSSGVNKLKEIISETPVLLLPTHRSYADFLLISYLAYHYFLPFPVIAAGMDFMSMAIIGNMLRGSGAFYIRRSFMDDKLYWAVFQEYVQTLLIKSGQPMEFFLEGTRSRSGKSLPPKMGLLGCVSESWILGKLPDIQIVPVSISYNRTLEETLYAYEMLGVPKPKESTSGLFKAMKILKENFGNIYVHFGHPISLSQYLSPRVDRHLSTAPDHLHTMNNQERKACESLANHVLRSLQMNCIISTWSLASICFMRGLWIGVWSIPMKTLLRETFCLSKIAQMTGSMVEGSQSKDEFTKQMKRSLKDHSQTVAIDANTDNVQVLKIHDASHPNTKQPLVSLHSSTIEPAVTHILLQYYVNQTLHIFIRPALVSMAIKAFGDSSVPKKFIQEKYNLLVDIFSYDFVFEADEETKDLNEALVILRDQGCIREGIDDIVEVLVKKSATTRFLCDGKSFMDFTYELIGPFILAYQVVVAVVSSQSTWTSESSLICSVQKMIERSVVKSELYSSLSLDTCRHGIKMLQKLGAITKEKSSTNDLKFVSNVNRLSMIREALKPSLVVSIDLLQPKL